MREFGLSFEEMRELTLYQFKAMCKQLGKERDSMDAEPENDTQPKAVYKVTSAEDTRRLIEGLQSEGINLGG